MKRLSIVSGLIVAALALAIGTASASAEHQFTASAVNKPFPLKIVGRGEEQTLRFGKFKVACERTTVVGSITGSPASEIKVAQRFRECVDVEGRFENTETEPPIRFESPVEFTYYANGSAEVGHEEEMELGQITLRVGNTGGCRVVWPRQKVPLRKIENNPEGEFGSVTYEPFEEKVSGKSKLKKFPSEFQQKLDIVNVLRNMKYEYKPKGLCENFETGEKQGSNLEGELEAEIRGGNLSWE
jgi:hypothetical protein